MEDKLFLKGFYNTIDLTQSSTIFNFGNGNENKSVRNRSIVILHIVKQHTDCSTDKKYFGEKIKNKQKIQYTYIL